ncbi:MAG: 3-deoxy-D-manno-octulosonic acid transferase [Rhodobacterales bacterium]|nr:MAG: 3-deoxy-D-manno-octulosonic acid transferase [Rhodobacterales bacterium]
MSLGLKLYLAGAKREGRDVPPDAQQLRLARPAGRLIWLHISESQELSAAKELIRLLSAEPGPLAFLLTTGAGLPVDPSGVPHCDQPCLHIPAPADTPQQVAAFLEHWRPTLAVWLGGHLRPALIVGAQERRIPLLLLNMRHRAQIDGRTRHGKGIMRDLLGLFDHIMAANGSVAFELSKQGAAADALKVCGVLQEGGDTLYCDERDRNELAEILASRPVWLAANLSADEEQTIIAAHHLVSRTAYRLLLILVPQDPGRGDALAQALTAQGWIVAQRSQYQDPDANVQILIADTEEEMGLWLRLSPICFLGQSLTENASGQSPLSAAALGSAILHGPYIARHQASYARLQQAGAAHQVADAQQLASRVEHLLAPDQAAAMASAGWEVVTAGAEAADQALEVITAILDETEDR